MNQIGGQTQLDRQFFSANGSQPQLLRQLEDDLNFLGKWNLNLNFSYKQATACISFLWWEG
jgi:hypothetical protein